MFDQLHAAWDNLQPRQRGILVTSAVATLLGLAVVGYWSSRPDYSVLYSGLSQEDASVIVDELRSDKVPYRLGPDGRAILVPTSILYETRLDMAGKGMPKGSSIGFEVFDRSGLPGTDFSNNVNLQRALQGELSRTISSLEEIQAARVHLSLPKESLYEEPTPGTASVLLDLGPNGQLQPGQVRGIAYLVSSAVDGLDYRNVTIVDSAGHMLHGASADGTGLPESSLETAKSFSEALTRRLQTMLDAMLGPSMSIVRVQAELNMDTEETDQEKVEPLQDQAGKAVVREHTSEETYDATASPRGGGAAGVASSLASGAGAAGSEQSGNYVSKEQTREYEFSRTKTLRKRLPGQITRLSVAAVIDESLPAQAAMRVQDVLSAAAGIARDRGDTVVVERMKLQAAETAQENAKEMETAQKTESRQRIVSLLIKQGLPATVALVLVAVAIRALLEFRRSASEESEHLEPIPGDGSPLSLPEGLPAPPSLEQLAAQQAKAEEERLLRELQRVARERPEVLARELRAWMQGDDVL